VNFIQESSSISGGGGGSNSSGGGGGNNSSSTLYIDSSFSIFKPAINYFKNLYPNQMS